jgi:transposase
MLSCVLHRLGDSRESAREVGASRLFCFTAGFSGSPDVSCSQAGRHGSIPLHKPTIIIRSARASATLQFLFRRETGRFNGETFWEFLKIFREASVVSGCRVVAISDNLQYHRSKLHLEWRNQQAPEFGLDFLPPYSPDLNPIERVTKLTRRLCLHNRYFGLLDSVVAAVEDRFADWTKPTMSYADYAQLLKTSFFN